MQWGPSSPFYDAFETDPTARRANFFGRIGAKPRNQQRYFREQFEDVQDRYLGALGQLVLGGQSPTLGFSDYLTNYFGRGGEAEDDFRDYRIRRGGSQGVVGRTPWISGGTSSGPMF